MTHGDRDEHHSATGTKDVPRRRSRRTGRFRDTPTACVSPYIVRRIPGFELLSQEALEGVETQADWLLAEIGIRITGDPGACALFKDAGASVDGDRVRFDRGLVRSLCATAPSTFTMHARNPSRSVVFGGDNVVMAPADGAPFVTDMKQGRRYGTIKDHQNLTKLLQCAPALHHNPALICEPSDVPVNKRHLDIVCSQLRYSDKPIMGAVSTPERGEDTLELARIVFGDGFLDDHAAVLAGTAVQSPLTFNAETTGAIRTYATANQANMITPFIIAGAMSPATMAGTLAQAHAEAMAGIALSQLVRKGSPALYSVFVTTMDLKSGAPTYGTPESSLANFAIVQLGRRLGLPVRCGGHLTGSKLLDAQAMEESVASMTPPVMAGAHFIHQSAGWLEGGLTIGFEKFIADAEKCSSIARLLQGLDVDDNTLAGDAFLELGDESNFLGCGHTLRNAATANIRTELPDSDSFEAWTDRGSKDTRERAYTLWTRILEDYEKPPINSAVDEELTAYCTRRKASMDDAWY
ncbi:MAG: trimethylamine methyltransferase family protein [bacterium]|nr:trimethylamine methyltransferase family protein [bacterium]MDE0415330.1 trimethylamine methyltransferase family protein [bacterium]